MRALLALALIPLLGCGATFFVGGNTNTGAAAGTVSIVQLTVIDGNVNATVVTLVANGASNTLTFCGNNSSAFPMNTFVQISFTPAQPCISSFVVNAN